MSNGKVAPAPTAPTVPARAPSKMQLTAVVKGKIDVPLRVMTYGPPGVGKTTFGAGAPSPIFLCVEDGAHQLDVARFPAVDNWEDVVDAIRVLTDEAHTYRTLVIDTVDALEPLCWDHVCKRDRKPNIEAYGYGKGYSAALDQWRVLLGQLERLRRTKGMGIVMLAHSVIKTFQNPEGENYDRYQLKLHEKAGGLIHQWCDVVLFARHETFVKEGDGKGKGISTGVRQIHTQFSAAWDAKNRHALPDALPLHWEDFAAALKANAPEDAQTLQLRISAAAGQLQDAQRAAEVVAFAAKCADDASKLARVLDRVNALLKKEQGEETNAS